MRNGTIIPLILALLSCHPYPRLKRLLSLPNSPVEIGHYPHYLRLFSAPEIQARRLDIIKSDAEKCKNDLKKLLETRFGIRDSTPLEYSYTGYDSINNRIVVRYFARCPMSAGIAGWQVQIVYKLPPLVAEKIYLVELPLE